MPKQPERILLFRSGRHLRAAVEALRSASPGCDITVVATPAATAALDADGIGVSRRIVYDRTPFFRPFAFVTSAAGWRAIRGRFDRVCVLWNDPDGAGQLNVDHTALLVSPRGFTAITADGAMIPRRTLPLLAGELRRAAVSIPVAALLALCVFLPARVMRAIEPR